MVLFADDTDIFGLLMDEMNKENGPLKLWLDNKLQFQ